MSSIKKLEKVLEYTINNENEKASQLFKSYIIESAAQIHQSLVEDDEDIMEMDRDIEHDDMGDDFADEISADKDEIETEEMFGEDEDDMSAGDAVDELETDMGVDDLDLDGEFSDSDMDLEDTASDLDTISDEVADLTAKFEKLSAEFEAIKNDEEVEHGEDYDNDGDLGGEEVDDFDGEEVEDSDSDFDFDDETVDNDLEESVDLHSVKADTKDMSPGKNDKSPVAKSNDRLNRLGGEPVKIVDKGHKGFERETKTVGKITKHTNTVNGKASSALSKVSVDSKDKAPGAGESPAMPKGRK